MKLRLALYTVLTFLLGLSAALAAKPKAPTRASLEKQVKQAPGDMSARCQLIELLLEQGDTVAAETHISLADKLQVNACVQIQKARIACARARYNEASLAYAKAFTLDAFPPCEQGAYRSDSLTRGALSARLKAAAARDKANTCALVACAELALYRGDTTEGVALLRQALQRGDTLQRVRVDSLSRTLWRDTVEAGRLLYSLPFERKHGVPTLSVTINGLRMKAEIDTTATRCTISSIEANFMIKNDYLTSSMVLDNHIVLLPTLQLTDSLALHDLQFYNDTKQSSPLVMNLSAFAQLGVARIHPTLNLIEIYQRQ